MNDRFSAVIVAAVGVRAIAVVTPLAPVKRDDAVVVRYRVAIRSERALLFTRPKETAR